MKIKRIKWKSHPILGDLELDFTNTATGTPFDTVLFAGENGTGKTTILESISTFLNRGSFEYFELIEYIVNGKIYTAIPATHPHKNFYAMTDDKGTVTQIHTDGNNNSQLIDENQLDIRHYGCIFSKARADYKTSQITSTTTKTLDTEKYDLDQEDNFTSLKQLIVDVEYQDNADYAQTNQALETSGENPKSWTDFFPTSRIYRFKTAFDNFFDKIKYEKVDNINSEKSILFKKNSKSISIDKLSTGEKQIVFRGIYLLKNSQKLNGATIMIDEPELSMHPKWQKNILKYYKELFTVSGIQKTQIFIATHSEHVLSAALNDKNTNIVITLNEDNGIIASKKIDAPSVLPTITSTEINYFAFNIVSNDYHIELYGYLQQKQSKITVKSCDDYIKGHSLYNAIKHCKRSSFGSTNYETLSTYIRNTIDHPDNGQSFSEDELRTSIELLIELCK